MSDERQRSLWDIRTWPRPVWLAIVVLGLAGAGGAAWYTRIYLSTRTAGSVGALRSLITANEQFKQCGVVDCNADGMGEYGWLGELSGRQAVRGSGLKMNTSPFIAAVLGVKDDKGRARLKGWVYHLALPLEGNRWQLEPELLPPEEWGAKTPEAKARAAAREKHWLCYAWPDDENLAVRRAYFADERGEIWFTDCAVTPYRGDDGPRVSAAFVKGGNGRPGAGQAPSYTGTDGNTWTLLER